ncbi:MAG: DUF6933 domain-containing protein [Clostridia bacterium]
MILYVTKQTFERYKFKMPEDFNDPFLGSVAKAVIERESGDRLLEWGGKLFYFDRRKCIQVVNFASKLTFVLVDIKMDDREHIGNIIANYMFNLYEGNKRMINALERLFEEHPVVSFAPLKDKGIIATLNHTQTDYLLDGYRLAEYIKDGILHTIKFNNDINRKWLFTQKINGKTEYIYPAERFEQLMCERYAKEIF